MGLVSRRISLLLCCAGLLLAAGCGEPRQHVVPVKGRVLYNDKPLAFGGVMFQPENGLPARGTIQSDGTFTLTTYSNGDGGTVGMNKVRVTCFPSQSPEGAGDASKGELPTAGSLIPTRYNDYSTSELTIEIKPEGNDDVVIRLVD